MIINFSEAIFPIKDNTFSVLKPLTISVKQKIKLTFNSSSQSCFSTQISENNTSNLTINALIKPSGSYIAAKN